MIEADDYFLSARVALYCGDCLDVLARLDPDTVDSCVTDPPYHLTSIVQRYAKGDAKTERSIKASGTQGVSPYMRGARGFMGKAWDGGDVAFRVELWEAVWRVLKPGAHLVAFGGTRTYHRMACAIEDAGFEIRDQIGWAYGSGFPKSHSVSRGIDRARYDREQVLQVTEWIKARRDEIGVTNTEINEAFGFVGMASHWTTQGEQPQVPTLDQWPRLMAVLRVDVVPPEIQRLAVDLNGMKGQPGEAWFKREQIGTVSGTRLAVAPGQDSARDDVELVITAPHTDAAQQWDGWGTALKPAWEPIVLARKPLGENTVAANVTKWGTGALNINACRVAGEGNKTFEREDGDRSREQYRTGTTIGGPKPTDLGRWPANLAHDGSPEVVEAFPESEIEDDAGSAARFFYTAKADADERIGSKHPTVKPLDLMQWLTRLVTPPRGLVLDPFAGTGTTGEAAWREGFNAALIEREPEYQTDVRRRMALALAGPDARGVASIKARGLTADAGPLFGGKA